MEESALAKKFLCTKTEGNGDKRRGRPKLRWCEESEREVTRVSCRNWRINVHSREKWQKISEGATCHPGTQTQWKKKNRNNNNHEYNGLKGSFVL
jgi:hypothetical protein